MFPRCHFDAGRGALAHCLSDQLMQDAAVEVLATLVFAIEEEEKKKLRLEAL